MCLFGLVMSDIQNTQKFVKVMCRNICVENWGSSVVRMNRLSSGLSSYRFRVEAGYYSSL